MHGGMERCVVIVEGSGWYSVLSVNLSFQLA